MEIVIMTSKPQVEFLEIQTKVLRIFLLDIHNHLYSPAWDFYFFNLTQPLTVSVKEKGGHLTENQTPFPMV